MEGAPAAAGVTAVLAAAARGSPPPPPPQAVVWRARGTSRRSSSRRPSACARPSSAAREPVEARAAPMMQPKAAAAAAAMRKAWRHTRCRRIRSSRRSPDPVFGRQLWPAAWTKNEQRAPACRRPQRRQTRHPPPGSHRSRRRLWCCRWTPEAAHRSPLVSSTRPRLTRLRVVQAGHSWARRRPAHAARQDAGLWTPGLWGDATLLRRRGPSASAQAVAAVRAAAPTWSCAGNLATQPTPTQSRCASRVMAK